MDQKSLDYFHGVLNSKGRNLGWPGLVETKYFGIGPIIRFTALSHYETI